MSICCLHNTCEGSVMLPTCMQILWIHSFNVNVSSSNHMRKLRSFLRIKWDLLAKYRLKASTGQWVGFGEIDMHRQKVEHEESCQICWVIQEIQSGKLSDSFQALSRVVTWEPVNDIHCKCDWSSSRSVCWAGQLSIFLLRMWIVMRIRLLGDRERHLWILTYIITVTFVMGVLRNGPVWLKCLAIKEALLV